MFLAGNVPGKGKRGRESNGKRPRPLEKRKRESIKPNAFTFYYTFNLIIVGAFHIRSLK